MLPVYSPGARVPGSTDTRMAVGVVVAVGAAESQLPPEEVTVIPLATPHRV
jgi:hypothetical protein